jgi:hypothetical protein
LRSSKSLNVCRSGLTEVVPAENLARPSSRIVVARLTVRTSSGMGFLLDEPTIDPVQLIINNQVQ